MLDDYVDLSDPYVDLSEKNDVNWISKIGRGPVFMLNFKTRE